MGASPTRLQFEPLKRKYVGEAPTPREWPCNFSDASSARSTSHSADLGTFSAHSETPASSLPLGFSLALAGWFRITTVEWAVLILTIASVLILEGLNTAIEAAVDLASPQVHPKAKIAKDLAAGMVLIAAIAAIIVGVFIFGPRLRELFQRHGQGFHATNTSWTTNS